MSDENQHPEQQPQRKFLFISRSALLSDLSWQLTREGNTVKFFIGNRADKDVGDGFAEKIDSWQEHVGWADVIVFDDCDYGPLADKLRREGKAVIGGTPYTDRLEMDRDFAQQEMAAAGLNILPSWDFAGFDEALEFVRQNPGRYVVKPNGKAQNEKVLSFVGQEDDGRDILTMLEHYRKGWGTKIKSFQLQKFVSGVEVAVGIFFNGLDFVLPVCVNFEHKRMCDGDIGPSTGEMGTSMFWTGENRLFRETIAPMKNKLVQAGYTGYFDINCIVNSRGIYPLECTCRFGYPTINIQMEGITHPWGEILSAMANRQPVTLKTKRGFQIGIVVAVPPFPFVDPDAFRKYSEEATILFKKPSTEGIHPCDVKLIDGDWRLAGDSGYALVITGAGQTMDDARREAYARVKTITIPNMFYRTDIGERWHRDGDLLQTWGMLT